MRVALISALTDDNIYRSGESLGLKYLAAQAESHGHEVDLYEMEPSGISLDSLCQSLSEVQHDVIGFGALFTSNLPATLSLASQVRKHNSKAHITIGGQGTSFVWADILEYEPAIDSCVCFEGDYTFLDLIEKIETGDSNLGAVAGLYFREGSRISFSGFRAPVNNLDSLPFPKRDSNSMVLGDPHVMMMSSRGCSAHCTFCSSGSFGNKYHKEPRWRTRGVPNIIAEIEMLVRDYSVRAISFVDDDFLGACPEGPPRALAFVDAISRLPYQIKWSIECRVNEVSLPLFEKMKSAGLEHVLIGIDAGNEQDLRLFGKGATLQQAEQAVRILRELDLSFTIGFIMFHPDTSLARVAENVRFMRHNNLGQVSNILNRLELYRGSPLVTLFDRSKRLEQRGFYYSYNFLTPDIELLYQVLRKGLAPFREHERDFAKARFAAQTGIRAVASETLRNDINDHERRVAHCELDMVEQAITQIEKSSSSLAADFGDSLGQNLEESAMHSVRGLDAELRTLTHEASKQ